MYVYTKDTVASHIDAVNTKKNTYIKGHSGFGIHSIRKNITNLIASFYTFDIHSITALSYFELFLTPLTYIVLCDKDERHGV